MSEKEKKEGNKEISSENADNSKKGDGNNLGDRVSKIESKVYEERERKLKEMEEKLDKKMKDFENLVEEAESQGITTTGSQKKTDEEKVQEQIEAELDSFEAE